MRRRRWSLWSPVVAIAPAARERRLSPGDRGRGARDADVHQGYGSAASPRRSRPTGGVTGRGRVRHQLRRAAPRAPHRGLRARQTARKPRARISRAVPAGAGKESLELTRPLLLGVLRDGPAAQFVSCASNEGRDVAQIPAASRNPSIADAGIDSLRGVVAAIEAERGTGDEHEVRSRDTIPFIVLLYENGIRKRSGPRWLGEGGDGVAADVGGEDVGEVGEERASSVGGR